MISRNDESGGGLLSVPDCVHRHPREAVAADAVRQIRLEETDTLLDFLPLCWDHALHISGAIGKDTTDCHVRNSWILSWRCAGEFKSLHIRMLYFEEATKCIWNIYGV